MVGFTHSACIFVLIAYSRLNLGVYEVRQESMEVTWLLPFDRIQLLSIHLMGFQKISFHSNLRSPACIT